MKVLLCNNQPININCVKNVNSHYLSNPIKDTFYKSNVSFRGKNPFTPDEQTEINRANKNDAPSRAKLAELKAKGLNIKDALACLNLNNPLEVEEYIELTNNNNDLDTLDKIGLIAYEINDTERYKHLCKLGLEKYEALLATKLGLNDNEINTYFDKKNKGIELDIQEDELMFCIKNGVNNDEQFTRFAQLKNRKRSFQNETVRKKGDVQPYPIEYITHCIKEGKTDSDIEREDRLIELMDYKFTNEMLAIILNLSIEDYKKFLQNFSDIKNVKVALKFAKFTDEQRIRFKKLLDKKYDEDSALTLAILTDKQIEKFETLVKNGKNARFAYWLATFTEERQERYDKLINEGLDNMPALYLSGLTEEQYNRYKTLLNKHKDEGNAAILSTLTEEQSEKYIKLRDEGVSSEIATELVKLTEEQYKRYKCIKNNGVDKRTILDIVRLKEQEYIRYKRFIKDGEDKSYAYSFSKFSELEYEKYKNLVKKGIDKLIAIELAVLTEEQIERYLLYINEGETCYNALNIAKLTNEQYKAYQSLLKEFVNESAAINIAKLSAEQYERFRTLIMNGTDDHTAQKIARLTKDQYEIYKIFLNESEVSNLALDLAKLTEEQRERYKILVSKGEDNYNAIKFSKLTNNQYKRYKNLIKIGKNEFDAYDLACLTEEQYNLFQARINNGFDIETAIHIAQLTEEQGNRYIELVKSGEDKSFAYLVATLTDELYERYKKIPIQISDIQAIALAKTTNLTSVTPELIEKLPEDFWYLTSMGCEKEASEIIHKAIESMLLREENNDFVLSPLRNIEIRTPLVNYSSNYSYNQNNGDFSLSGTQSFSVNLSQGYISQKPLLVIKDKNSSNQYISYNGAIAQVKEINEHDSEQFRIWGNLSPQKQSKILSKAADEFIFNIFDEEGNCIIGQNSPKFNTKEKTDSEIEQYYAQKLLELKNRNELTPQNILKLMPKNCMLTISPYIQGGNILYAIVTEWFSKNGNRWQMEIHSQDLKYNNDEKWIFRLHKATNDGNKHYFKFAENENGYDFNGEFNGEDAHIKINTPLEDNNLLNNVAFQAIITLISAKLCKDFAINKVAEKIGVTVEENNSFATMGNIVKHCLKNVKDFANNKDQITKMRVALGKIRLV